MLDEFKPILEKIKKGWDEEERARKELREQLLKEAGRENVNWDSVVEVQASKSIFVESSSFASGWLIECPSHAESPGSYSPF
jgi:hypothetical protein